MREPGLEVPIFEGNGRTLRGKFLLFEVSVAIEPMLKSLYIFKGLYLKASFDSKLKG